MYPTSRDFDWCSCETNWQSSITRDKFVDFLTVSVYIKFIMFMYISLRSFLNTPHTLRYDLCQIRMFVSLSWNLRCVVINRGFSACSHVTCQHRHAVNRSTDLTETWRPANCLPESQSLVAGQEDEARTVLSAPIVWIGHWKGHSFSCYLRMSLCS